MKIVRPGGSVTLPKVAHAGAIYEAILQFDWNDPTKWTEGRPKVREIEKILADQEGGKVNVTEKTRDAVWKVFVQKVEDIVAKAKRDSNVKVNTNGGSE